MLFRQRDLEGIRDGAITVAFRRWRRPTVRTGGTLLTPIGQLDIRSVEVVALSAITGSDARRAGFASRAALIDALQRRAEGDVYRIELGALRPDPRIALRETPATDAAATRELRDRLRRYDARSPDGAWTARTMAALRAHPGVRAGDVCALVGHDRERFKRNVRKLKHLGLTESLGTGYRLSPRGEALLDALDAAS
jgi:hypothetical protein